MAEELGARLVRAGLVTRDQLARALARGAVQGGALAAALLDGGLSGDALAGFFVADGFGPLLDGADLAAAQPGPLNALPPEMAHSLLALPVRHSPAGIVIAMADPSDAHAVAELRYATGGDVLPTVAKVPDLKAALERAYPMFNARDAEADDAPSEPPLELTRRKDKAVVNRSPVEDEVALPLVSKKPHPTPPPASRSAVLSRTFSKPVQAKFPPSPGESAQGESAQGESTKERTASYRSPSAKAPERASSARPVPPPTAKAANVRAVVPATTPRPKPSAPVVAGHATPEPAPAEPASAEPASAEPAPAEPASAEPAPAELAPAEPAPSKPPRRSSAAERASSQPPRTSSSPPHITPEDDGNSWGKLSEKSSSGAVAAPTSSSAPPVAALVAPPRPAPRERALAAPRRESKPPGEIGTTLAGIRSSEGRDEVVRLACEGGLTVARSACLLALRKGVLKGWDGVGGGVSQDAIRNLWIPATSPSIFKQVLDTGEPYAGAYGTTAADNLYRASTGSRGGTVVVQPVRVKGRTVAVLVADDVGYGPLGKQRLEVLAQSVGEAFKRIITAGRRG